MISKTSQSKIDTLIDVTKYAIRKLKLKISDNLIKEALLKHPEYPKISSLADILTSLNIKNKTARLNQTHLLELDPFFFVHLQAHGLVFITKLSTEFVEYYSPVSGLIKENMELFSGKWNGITLLFDATNYNEENNYKSKVIEKIFWDIRQLSVIIVPLILIVSYFFITDQNLTSAAVLLKLMGSLVCCILTKEIIKDKNQPSKLCKIGEKINCSDVLNSSASKVFNLISLSDIGIIYFTGSLAITIIGVFNNQLFSSILILPLLSIPFTLFSLYYQGFVLKKWCLYCLSIVCILWVENIISILIFRETTLNTPSLLNMIIVLSIFWVVTIIWSYVKEYLLKSNELAIYKYRYFRISNNKDVFSVLQEGMPIVDSNKFDIYIGNPNATDTIKMVMSPNCENCANDFKKISELYNKYRDKIKIQFILTSGVTTSSLEDDITTLLLEIYYSHGEEFFFNELSNWFRNKNFKEFKSKYKQDISERAVNTLIDHTQWIQKSNITLTPVVFFNNKKLNNYYSIEQLNYFFLKN